MTETVAGDGMPALPGEVLLTQFTHQSFPIIVPQANARKMMPKSFSIGTDLAMWQLPPTVHDYYERAVACD